MNQESNIPPRLIEIIAENNRETVSIDAIVSVGMYAASRNEGYYVRILLGERLLPVDFFYRSDVLALEEYRRINEARLTIDAWVKGQ